MRARTDGGPAFPTLNGCKYDDGMSLRDWFAGMALQGLWSKTLHEDNNNELLSWNVDVYAHQAMHCYEMAEAMIAARKETP